MPDAPEVHSLNAAAADAAAADDFTEAASLLQQVHDLQQGVLGPNHPDLATTLNNLALMLERSGEIDAAGRCYERAHAIASGALAPDDPIVHVSDENLRAFRRAYGRADAASQAEPHGMGLEDFAPGPEPTRPVPPRVEEPSRPSPPPPSSPPGAPPEQAGVARDTATSLRPSREAPDTRPAEQKPAAVARGQPASRVRLALIVAIVVLLLIVAALWRGESDPPDRSAAPDGAGVQAAAPATASAPAAAPPPRRDAPGSLPGPPVPAPPPDSVRGAVNPALSGPDTGSTPDTTAATSKARGTTRSAPSTTDVEVVQASVCRSLSREGGVWTCQDIDSPARPGFVAYYTRVASARDIEVRHRWARDGQVLRVSRLRIGANPSAGFRTYTRQAVEPGEWEVTLLGPDNRVLHEQRFVVR